MDTKKLKKDFPIFKHDPTLVYLDSTATSLKPQAVIDKENEYYTQYSANVHRGIYKISEKATEEYEETRTVVAQFINAQSSSEIIYTRNCSESLNLIASTLGTQIVGENDEVITTIMEHHSNFIPWQQLAERSKAKIHVVGVSKDGLLDIEKLYSLINKKTKIVAFTYVSNALGTINPVKEIIAEIKKRNPAVMVVVDAAQAVPHMQVDVQDLGCDFLAFSSHKMLGPTGIGILWGKLSLLNSMPPYQFGGEMITEVRVDGSVFKEPPHKFEAGTPHIAGAIALKAAVQYLQSIGMDKIREHEKEIITYALKRLEKEFKGDIQILGPKDPHIRGGIITFNFKKYHPHDIAQILDEDNISVRAGHHCTMPLHTFLEKNATARVSFYVYNSEEDVEKLITGLKKIDSILK